MACGSLNLSFAWGCFRNASSGRWRDAPGRPARRNTRSRPPSQKYIAFPKFGFVAWFAHPGLARGALRDRHEMRAGVRWTRQRRRGDAVTGAENPLSHARRGTNGGCHSGQVDRRRCAHRAPARRPGRPRTEKSCGPDARKAGVKPSGDAAARPGTCIIEPQGDGGNSASLPEESTKDTVKTSRAGKAGRPARPVVHPVCILVHTDSGASRRPAFPAPSGSFEGANDMAKLGRNAPRDRESLSAMKVPIERAIRCRKLRHCERSEAIQNLSAGKVWIASSLRSSQ